MFNEEKSENGILQLDENSKMERKCSSQGLERRGDRRLESRIIYFVSLQLKHGRNE